MNEAELAAGLPQTANYRYGDVVGDRLYVAGQVPVDGDNRVVGIGDVAAQARQCIDNLRALLAAHGFTTDDVHHLTVYVVGDHDALVTAWGGVSNAFHDNVPPATLLGVSVLGFTGQLVEVDAQIERAG
ncbi:MAG TPA: RidA family protein [Acidimicrobiia bacterium]|nr:RidA family protein [Acidimicrobiia bacterium]